jgi:hypothetical protein
MKQYTDFGANRNSDVPDDREGNTDRLARRISYINHVTYLHALALVRANGIVKEARDE